MDRSSVILILSGLVLILAIVGAIPALLDVDGEEHVDQDTALNDEMADLFNMARRASSYDYSERAKRDKFKKCTMKCVSCNKEIKGYKFFPCLSGCQKSGAKGDSNCLRYLTK